MNVSIDHGFWIHSAGVVSPGVSSCDPIGEPSPISPKVVDELEDEPTPTHKWWGSIPFHGEMTIGDPNKAAYITPDPVYARISNKGVRVLGIPNGMRVNNPGGLTNLAYSIPDPFAEVFDGIAVGNSEHSELRGFLKAYSDASVTVQWQSSGEAVMEATFVHGSPYIYIKALDGELVVKTKSEDGVEKGTFYESNDNHLGVWTNVAGIRTDFLISGEGDTEFENSSSNTIMVKNATNELTLTLLPANNGNDPSTSTVDFFAQSARNVVQSVTVDYSVNRNDNAVTVTHTYLDAEGNAIETVAGMHPLHWKYSTENVDSPHQVRSARGIVKFSQLSEFSYEMPFVGVLPYLPSTVGDLDQDRLEALVEEYAEKGPENWNVGQSGDPNLDTYWAGKSYGKWLK